MCSSDLVRLMGGGTRAKPCIWFSGFWSQGDGACFEGYWSNAKGATARLAGAEVPSWPDDEKTFDELKARIAKTVAFVKGFSPEQFKDAASREITITIRGIDEADSLKQQVTWVSPIARAPLKAREGDVVKLVTPVGVQEVEVVEVRYPTPVAA